MTADRTGAGMEGMVTLTNSPEEALHDADVVVTDTWYVVYRRSLLMTTKGIHGNGGREGCSVSCI